MVDSIDFGTYDLVVARIEYFEVNHEHRPTTFLDGAFTQPRRLSAGHD